MNDSIFVCPEYVDKAPADSFDTSAKGAVVVDKYRIDTPAGAWAASADLRKLAMEGKKVNSYTLTRVNEACSLFGIGDDQFQLPEVPCDDIIVKTASHTAEFHITDCEQLQDSVHDLLEKRDNYPLSFCRKCANALLDYAYEHNYDLSKQDETDLLRLGGTAHFNKEAAAYEIKLRGDYARNNNDEDYAARMYKLATMSSQLDANSSAILTSAVTDAVDLFDHHFNILNKLASLGMSRIEDAVYLTAEEALQKSANDPVMVDDEHSIPKGRLLTEATRNQMSKWASMQGYSTSPEMNDILDCVASMPGSLREEFCQIFA